MRFRIVEIEVKNVLSKSGLPDIDYALNPYVGCAHGCLYCYAKAYIRYKEVVDNWGGIVVVKKNLIPMLLREVKEVKKGSVGIGTITDPYQPVEAIYRLSRKSIEVLAENGFRISIQTKSSLILRDIDILRNYRDVVDVGITITSTSNTSPMTMLEPYSSPPKARIEALRKLSIEGVKTWIFYGPIVPGYNDDIDEISKVLRIAKETGSDVYIDMLRVKKFMYSNQTLRVLARKSVEYNWEKLLESIQRLCRSLNLICRYGFEYSGEKPSKSLDQYLRKS
jgi:DNA repair photolyase